MKKINIVIVVFMLFSVITGMVTSIKSVSAETVIWEGNKGTTQSKGSVYS